MLGEDMQGTHEDDRGLQTSLSDRELHGESSLREANNPLEMADTDNETRDEALPHKSSGQPTEHVELWLHGSGGKSTGDGELRTCRPKDEQQEHGESL